MSELGIIFAILFAVGVYEVYELKQRSEDHLLVTGISMIFLACAIAFGIIGAIR